MKILDATCGFRGIWYQKNHPFVTYIDNRNENIYDPRINARYKIKPDMLVDWTKELPFENDYFDMVIFDPPHLIRKRETKESTMMKQYGYLYENNYKQILKKGISGLFRILKSNGVFIFKWNEESKKITEIFPLFPYKPLFGSQVGQHGKTYWVLFIKHKLEKELDIGEQC